MLVGDVYPAIRERLAIRSMSAPVRQAAADFATSRTGLIVVCGRRGRALGVVSESDVIVHFARRGDADEVLASIMTRSVVSCSPYDDLHQTWARMVAQGFQALAVLSSDFRPLGVLDIRDALLAILQDGEAREGMLVDYIAGNGYR